MRAHRTRRRRRAGIRFAAWDQLSRSAQRELRLDRCDEFVRYDVGEDLQAFEHGDAISDLAHDGGDRNVEGLGHGREDLARGLLLTALHLAEVAERYGCLARDLPEGAPFLQAEVPQHIADFLSYKNHRNLLPVPEATLGE